MQNDVSQFVVNLVPLFNIQSNTSGLDATATLSNSVGLIQQMVDTTTNSIFTNSISAFTTGNTIQVQSPININNQFSVNLDNNITTDGNATFTGNVYAQSFITTSDERVKRNIVPYQVDVCNRISSIGLYKYNYIGTVNPVVGVLAQEVEAVFPECVETREGAKYVNYQGLTAILLQSVKELSRRVAELESANSRSYI